MYTIVLVRHGESLWNHKNLFTGWHDVDLDKAGNKEAKAAGVLLKKKNYTFDIVYTSLLKRAIHTAWHILDKLDLVWIPMAKCWELNERHYGALEGLNKSETVKKFGEKKVLEWRRSFDIPPPKLSKKDPRYDGNDPRYADVAKKDIPLSECLADVVDRVVPFWKQEIVPKLKKGEKIIIVAHGNSMRALVMHLDKVSKTEIPHLNIPTGVPLVYELDKNCKPIKHYYL
ncbi:MAG: 2,3-bisphosphoglycerate-dependent phosphoglycerate mutase, partial [Candidatus Woesearchaeota archaeon]